MDAVVSCEGHGIVGGGDGGWGRECDGVLPR